MKQFKTLNELFNHIWDNRPHISEISGKPLLPKGNMKWHWQMAHILSRGAYPSFRLNPDNIMLMLPEEHEKQEQYEVFQEKQLELKRQYYTLFYGKEFD